MRRARRVSFPVGFESRVVKRLPAFGERRQVRMKFGRIPPWARDWKKDSVRTFNAKAETVGELKSFKPAWDTGAVLS